MTLQIEKAAFDGLADALKDCAARGLWPTTYVSGTAPAADIHWHDEDVHIYVMKGQTTFLDAESGKSVSVVAGDKIVVPARALHAEGEVVGEAIYLIGLPRAVPPADFLAMRDPRLLEKQD